MKSRVYKFTKFSCELFFLIVASLSIHTLAALAQSEVEVSDPIEPVNRGVFWFNEKFDDYVGQPVAEAYHDNVADRVQKGVSNFFNNLRYPTYLVSDLIQFKFTQALEHTGRFLINTTVGVAGLMDVAKDVGLPDHQEDFGIALAYRGIPPGPYIVLPFVGPSNLRDTVGLAVDTVINPLYWVTYSNASSTTKTAVSVGGTALKFVDTRAGLLDAIDTAKESSVDYYLFMQGAYYQYRRGVLYDGNAPDEYDDEFEKLPPSDNK